MTKKGLYQKVYGSPNNPKKSSLYATKEKDYSYKSKKKVRVGYDLGLCIYSNKLKWGVVRYPGLPPRVAEYKFNKPRE